MIPDSQTNFLYLANTLQRKYPGFYEEFVQVLKQFEGLFPGKVVATVNSNELALDGGILNCISWNIYK